MNFIRKSLQSKSICRVPNCYASTVQRKDVTEKNPPIFKNVKLITPTNMDYFLFNSLKLKFVEEKNVSKTPGVELLRNIASNYDYWIIRSQQEMLLYYRLQMMQQRLDYLKPVGMTPLQKLRHLQKSPPALLFSFSGTTYQSKMVYLRGMAPQMENDFLHLFYPITRKVKSPKTEIKDRVSEIEGQLQIKQPSVLRELLNMPIFFMDPSCLTNVNHVFVHKYSMPYDFDIDKQTVDVLPPIVDLKKSNISASRHCSNKATNESISELPSFQLKDLLDYSYPSSNGRGKPECLSSFLVQAELEEDKDRTTGQPLKGRRGFNVPPRQY